MSIVMHITSTILTCNGIWISAPSSIERKVIDHNGRARSGLRALIIPRGRFLSYPKHCNIIDELIRPQDLWSEPRYHSHAVPWLSAPLLSSMRCLIRDKQNGWRDSFSSQYPTETLRSSVRRLQLQHYNQQARRASAPRTAWKTAER